MIIGCERHVLGHLRDLSTLGSSTFFEKNGGNMFVCQFAWDSSEAQEYVILCRGRGQNKFVNREPDYRGAIGCESQIK